MRIKKNDFFSLFNSYGEWEAKVLGILKGIVQFKIIKNVEREKLEQQRHMDKEFPGD